MSELILPRTYKDISGKFPQHDKKPRISYSQYTAWKGEYKNDYIKQYFANIELPDSIWARGGNDIGEYIEWKGNGMKGERPKSIILTQNSFDNIDGAEEVDYPEGCVYEDLVVVDCGDFVVEGYTDRTQYIGNKVRIRDYKTGNKDKKAKYYASDEYQQVPLYALGKIQEGYEIDGMEVVLMHRKGNGSEKSPIYLTGEIVTIPLTYDENKIKNVIEDMKKVVLEISDCYKTYLKYFGNG